MTSISIFQSVDTNGVFVFLAFVAITLLLKLVVQVLMRRIKKTRCGRKPWMVSSSATSTGRETRASEQMKIEDRWSANLYPCTCSQYVASIMFPWCQSFCGYFPVVIDVINIDADAYCRWMGDISLPVERVIIETADYGRSKAPAYTRWSK